MHSSRVRETMKHATGSLAGIQGSKETYTQTDGQRGGEEGHAQFPSSKLKTDGGGDGVRQTGV